MSAICGADLTSFPGEMQTSHFTGHRKSYCIQQKLDVAVLGPTTQLQILQISTSSIVSFQFLY
jgi:hypothetical protein